MASIDRADWHYGGDFPENLPIENGGTHIGMYLNWIIDNDLIGVLHLEDSVDGIKEVKSRKISGRDFLFQHCDGKFWNEDLNEEGLEFTKYYYQSLNNSDEAYGQYLNDYVDALGENFDSIYEIPNTWKNYDKLVKIIDSRYQEWKG